MAISLLLILSCEKEKTSPAAPVDTGKINFTVSYTVNGQPLVFDTVVYSNLANNKFIVTRLFYYLSALKTFTGTEQNSFSDIIYLDASKRNESWLVNNVPTGNYQSLSFLIGLDAAHNISGSLPNTMDNINMAWPDEMGGGYHFMKLEGHYTDTASKERGFTMHLGKTALVVNHNILSKEFSVVKDQTTQLTLTMDVAEWFKNPYTYNFNTDGNYTMGVDSLMQILSNNGKDVFQLR